MANQESDEARQDVADAAAKPASRRLPAFDIQWHASRRMRFELRLELDGVLKSWAVAKGPSLDPSARRPAVENEDRPLASAEFEGPKPHGRRGAGSRQPWDGGTWHPIGDASKSYREGRLSFELEGRRLKGRWSLVRRAGEVEGPRAKWLLIKGRDRHARPGSGDAPIEIASRAVRSRRDLAQHASSARRRMRRRKQRRAVPASRAAEE